MVQKQSRNIFLKSDKNESDASLFVSAPFFLLPPSFSLHPSPIRLFEDENTHRDYNITNNSSNSNRNTNIKLAGNNTDNGVLEDVPPQASN